MAKRKPLIGITCSFDSAGPGRIYLPQGYARAVQAAGGIPLPVPSLTANTDLEQLLTTFDGLLFSGGVDVDPVHWGEEPAPSLGTVDPERDTLELALARLALSSRRELPILGICRGIQLLNIAAGGTVVQDLGSWSSKIRTAVPLLKHSQDAPDWYGTHQVSLAEHSMLTSIFGCAALRVNSYHHQAVDKVAPGFVVTAAAPDGVIEGIEAPGQRFAVGVQWHPERMWDRDPLEQKLFEAFVRAAHQDRQV